MLEMREKWKIDSIINDTQTSQTLQEQQILLNMTSKLMLAAMRHETLIRSKGHSSKFVRSSKLSNEIAHNSYMATAITTGLSKERFASGEGYFLLSIVLLMLLRRRYGAKSSAEM